MSSLIISTVLAAAAGAGPDLEVHSDGSRVHMKPLGPIPKAGILIEHHDARLLAAVLAEWTDAGPEGA